MPRDTPAFSISSGPSWRCVVEAGWQASVLQSPIFTSPGDELERVLERPACVAPALHAEVEDAGRAPAHVSAAPARGPCDPRGRRKFTQLTFG